MTISRPSAVLTSTAFLGHDTGQHPEQPARIEAIFAELNRRDLLTGRPEIEIKAAPRDTVARVHDPRYLETLDQIVELGGGWIDPDTMCAEDSVEVAYLAAGAAVSAVDAVLDGAAARAFAIARPPGHHALATRAMGFCLLNSVAIAAQHARDRGLERVAIIDWDVHHGNGTQAMFYDRADILFCSIQQFGGGFFPGSGSAGEVGTGIGEGFTLNVPLRSGSGDNEYLNALRGTVAPAVEAFRPELILVSAGFDAHQHDPLGSMRVTDKGFRQMAEEVRRWVNAWSDGKLVAVLEGGYDQPALGRSVAEVLEALDAES